MFSNRYTLTFTAITYDSLIEKLLAVFHGEYRYFSKAKDICVNHKVLYYYHLM